MFGVLISALLLIPYIWTVVNEPNQLYYRASRIFTFSNGLNVESTKIFLMNYLSHFSPAFLFIHGDPNLRHGAQTGTIYWVMLPFLIAGLVYLIISRIERRVRIFIIFWIAIFPLAASLTNDGAPHATRSLVGAPIMCILSGFGVVCLVQSIDRVTGRKRLSFALYPLIIIVSLISLLIFSKKYFYQYPKTSFAYWEYGYKDIFSEIHKIEANYKRVCIETLDYYHEQPILDYYTRDSKLDFINTTSRRKCKLKGTILVQNQMILKYQKFNLIKIIRAPNGQAIYYIYGRPKQSGVQKNNISPPWTKKLWNLH